MKIYVICGYGLPKDIRKDQNYLTYLHVAFNRIYAESVNQSTILIPSGGSTSCEPPFVGTEAEIMENYLEQHIEHAGITEQTRDWKFYPEKESLSTLENLLFVKNIVNQNNFVGDVIVFCEKTREERIKKIAMSVFGDRVANIIAIDFDVSRNRYLDPQVIAKKEAEELRESLWALENPERIEKHHKLFEKKLVFLRGEQKRGVLHVDAVAEWYKIRPQIVKELMPDHPFFADK